LPVRSRALIDGAFLGRGELERRRDAERHIRPQIEMGKGIVILEDHRHRPLRWRGVRHVLAIEQDAAGLDAVETGDDRKKRRFAGT